MDEIRRLESSLRAKCHRVFSGIASAPTMQLKDITVSSSSTSETQRDFRSADFSRAFTKSLSSGAIYGKPPFPPGRIESVMRKLLNPLYGVLAGCKAWYVEIWDLAA